MITPRLGHINFLNVLPLTYSFHHDNFADGLKISNGVPAVVNNDLINNRLDAAEVSSIVYARNSEKLFLLPDVCVRSDSEVQSIILVSRKPIYDINEDKIILTAKSATSHCLLKIIMRNGYDARPNYYVRHISPENPVPADATASLLIGDDALWLYHNRKKYDYYYYDLGREWKKMTGVGMVYATWVVNRDFVKQHHKETKMLYDRIYRGIQNGYAKKDEIIKSILDDKPFTYDQVSVYLERIRWNLTDEYLEGLKLFYSMAHDMNLIDHRPEIEVADVYY